MIKQALISQRLRLDETSKIDPLTLLDKISRNGISQDVCVNDLGMNLKVTSFPYATASGFSLLVFIAMKCVR